MRDSAHPVRLRAGRLRRTDRRLTDQRESVPDGKVRTRGRAHCEYRLQRSALYGVGGGRVEEDSRHRSQRQPLERHSEGEGDSRRRRERRRVRPDHHRLSLAGARERRKAHRARSAYDADRPHRRPLYPRALRRGHRRLLRHAPRHGAARLDQPRVHRRAYHRLGRRRGYRRALHPGIRGDYRQRARLDDRARGRNVGTGREQLPPARPRHRAPLKGRRELHRRHQPGGGHRSHRARRLRLRDDHRSG